MVLAAFNVEGATEAPALHRFLMTAGAVRTDIVLYAKLEP